MGAEKKFKTYQEVIVLGLRMNGEKADVGGRFIRYCTHPGAKGKVEVLINTVNVYTTEDRLVDAEEYWKEKNKGKKG